MDFIYKIKKSYISISLVTDCTVQSNIKTVFFQSIEDFETIENCEMVLGSIYYSKKDWKINEEEIKKIWKNWMQNIEINKILKPKIFIKLKDAWKNI